MKQEHEMTPGVLVSGEVLSAGDARARVAVLEAEVAELRKRVCVPEGWTHDKPVVPGAYWVRGNGLEEAALVVVKPVDNDLWCNLHVRTTEPDFYYGYAVAQLDGSFEWLGPLAAAPAPVERVDQEAQQSEPVAIWDDMTKLARATSNRRIKHGAPLYATPQPAAPAPDVADYEQVLDDHRRLASELDVLLNGEEGAAQQTSLADLVAQLRTVVRNTGKPVLAAQDVAGLVEALRAADEYLSDNRLNEIGSGSILHRQMQDALAAHQQREGD